MGEARSDHQDLREELERLRREIRELRTAEARREEAERALRESEERHRRLLDLFPDAFIFYDIEGRVVFVNAAFERIYGWPRQAWHGRQIDFVPPHEVQRTREATQRVLAGETVVLETQRLTRDGRILDVEIRATPVRDPAGELAGIYAIHRDITEEKRQRRALQETETRYRMLLDASPDAIAVYDARGKILYVNPAFEKTFGWTLEELAGRGVDFVPPHERERTRDAVERTLRGETVLLDTQRLTKDGRILDIQLKTCVFRDAEGNLAGDIVIYRDLTAHKRTEAELAETRAQYRLLLDASPDPISVYSPDGKILYVNPAFEKTFGWTLEELAGRGVDFVPPHERERTRAAVERTLRGENVFLETQRLTKDGRLLDIQLKTAVFRDPNGNLAGDIVIYRDVTELKRREKELERYRLRLEELVEERTRELIQANRRLEQEVRERERAQQALRESEERHRALFQSAPDAIFLAEGDSGRILDVNPAAERLTGRSRGELVGRYLKDLYPPGHWRRLCRLSGEGAEARPEETTVLRRGGPAVPVEVLAERVRIGDRSLCLLVCRDIRERKRLEAQLQHAQRMEAVGTLAGGIAHDFRNILQIVQAHAETLLGTLSGDSPVREGLERILRACLRGSELTTQLLTFSRQAESHLRPVEINREVQDACAMLRRTIPRMIQIRTDLDPEAGFVLADPAQIEQMIVNLALNARDAMPTGGELRIETSAVSGEALWSEGFQAAPEERYVRLRVMDTGHGMDPETLRHIFDPFFTTKEVGAGTGLGLATVYGIVKGHRGHIACRSRIGQGTVFTIFLPRMAETDVEPVRGEPAAAEPAGAPAPSRRGVTVLLVDDEEEIRGVARELLETRGYRVLTAGSGEEALDVYRRSGERIEAVILDLGMPGMGGQRCLEELRALDPAVRVIVTTGYGEAHLRELLARAGARAFLNKPYRSAELARTLEEVLGG